MRQESFRAQLADYVLSGHAFLHCPTTEKTRFLAELKALTARTRSRVRSFVCACKPNAQFGPTG